MATSALIFAVLLAAAAAQQPTQTVVLRCPPGYQLVGGACYLLSPGPVSGLQAGAFCEGEGGQAAIVESRQEMDLLKGSILNSTAYLGINMQRYRGKLMEFLLKMDGYNGYSNFYSGEPDNYGTEACVLADASVDFQWKDVHCSELHPVLCKTPALIGEKTPTCDHDAHLFNSSCFWATGSQSYSWSDGEELCASRGMQLTSVHSQQEEDLVWDLCHAVWCWIGLNDVQREGVYVWSDGSPLDYTNWGGNEPEDVDGYDCVFDWGDGYWSDAGCYAKHGVVCRCEPS